MPQLDLQTAATAAFSLAFAYGVTKIAKSGSRDPQLPPGPPTLPIIGNLAILPLKDSYLKFTEWARIYGGVISLKVGSETIIVVSDLNAVNEILEKNGAITGSRPKFEPFRRFSGPGKFLLFAPYGALWRKLRKAAADLMKPVTRRNLNPIMMAEVSQLLYETHKDPENLFYHVRRTNASAMFSIIGGQRIPIVTSPLCRDFFHLWDMISEITAPGNAPPVDIFPILNLIPDKLARNWKARCDTIRQSANDVLTILIGGSEERLRQNQPNGCFVEVLLEKSKEWELDSNDIRDIAGSMVTGGTVTSASVMHFILLLAASFPDFQRKVHEELDRVIGDDSVPVLDDMANLPYLSAFIKEAHRFRPISSLGTPHCADEDQIYQGKLIPKGSTLFMNIWGIFHDPALYENPDTFDPERFIRSPYGTKPGVEEEIGMEALRRLEFLIFGSGRQRCVGLLMANETVAIVAASLFWAFEFSPLVDEKGEEIKYDLWAFDAGLSNDPHPFKCTVKPRSERRMQVIHHNFANSTPTFELFERQLSEEDRIHVQNVRSEL